MTSTPPQTPVPMQHGRREDRRLLARLRAERPWALRPRETPSVDAGLLVLRVVVGVTFVAHGLDKLTDLAAAERFFASLGIPAPGLMAPLVAVTETVGGLLLIAGLATALAGAALAGDMLVAYLTAHLGHGFFVSEGGAELVLLLGGGSVALVLTGAGAISLSAARPATIMARRHASRTASPVGARRSSQ